MSRTPAAVPGEVSQPDDPAPVGRLGPFFAAIWLFFLLSPLLAGWSHRDEPRGVLGMAVTVLFAAVYMWLWWQARLSRNRLGEGLPRVAAVGYLVSLVVLGALDIVLLGEPGLACTVYVGVACVMATGIVVAVPLVLVLTAATAVGAPLAGWGGQGGLCFAILAASVAIFGVKSMLARNLDLIRVQRVNADLAVENERTRFARDLHDILGHSLTVITVKAELAQRLFEVDPARARSEIGDLERLSRDALADVRRAVEGYRELTLPGELVRARTALGAAEISAVVPNSTDEVPSELRELFAWAIREGVTNVIRHANATRCEVRLTPSAAEIRDDGDGACANAAADGHGLAGLRERAGAVGATVVVRHLSPGFSLSVHRSAQRAGDRVAARP